MLIAVEKNKFIVLFIITIGTFDSCQVVTLVRVTNERVM